jgi:hypothetical protein
MSKVSKAEKAKRRRILAEIDQKADCGGHNRVVADGPSHISGDFLDLYLLTRFIRPKKSGGEE